MRMILEEDGTLNGTYVEETQVKGCINTIKALASYGGCTMKCFKNDDGALSQAALA